MKVKLSLHNARTARIHYFVMILSSGRPRGRNPLKVQIKEAFA